MPNWCSNKLVVSASKKSEVENFLQKVRGDDGDGTIEEFTFNSLVPRPKTEEDNWYDWNVQNWGTKWDASEPNVSLSENENIAHITFDTAWSPPIEWLEKVAPQFPHLNFTLLYYEGGMGFAGEQEYQEGEEMFHAQYDSGEEGYWEIATSGMSDEEIEEMATENIENNALDYWEYSFDDLLKYVGEENREKLENLIVAHKILGDMPKSFDGEYIGCDLVKVIDELIGTETFYKKVLEVKKQEGTLKRLAV